MVFDFIIPKKIILIDIKKKKNELVKKISSTNL